MSGSGTCEHCGAIDGHAYNCPGTLCPATAPMPPMSKEDRADFAEELRGKLNSRRDVFVIDKFMFEPYHVTGELNGRRLISTRATKDGAGLMPAHLVPLVAQQKTVSAAALKLLLDYCESDWDMDLVSYCAGVFHGREANVGETAFDLLPDVHSRLSADRLGFGHIYGGGK